MILTLILFPIVGLAISRVVGRVQVWLAGAGTVGLVLFLAGVLHVPLVAAVIVLFVVALVFIRPKVPRPNVIYLVATFLLFLAALIPLNDYDGRAFWILKAKAIAYDQSIDGPFFHGATGLHPRNEYPLLVPLDAAVLMAASRELNDRHTRWLYVMFAVALALEIARRCGTRYALLLLVLPQLVIENEGGLFSAYSDIALGAFIACAFFELVDAQSPLRLGMWTSFALLTKSEGLPLAMLVLLAGAYVFRRRIVLALIPFVPALAALFVWRARIPASDEKDFAHLIFHVPLDRFVESLAWMAEQFIAIRDWGLFSAGVLVAAIILARRREWRPLALAAFIAIPMLVLYAAVHAVAGWEMDVLPYNLAPRMLTHLIGPAMFVFARALVTDDAPPAFAI